jgi:hypothetical protein
MFYDMRMVVLKVVLMRLILVLNMIMVLNMLMIMASLLIMPMCLNTLVRLLILLFCLFTLFVNKFLRAHRASPLWLKWFVCCFVLPFPPCVADDAPQAVVCG